MTTDVLSHDGVTATPPEGGASGHGLSVRYVDTPAPPAPVTFTICTLLADDARYDALLQSFARLGFTAGNTEFIAFDNRGENRFDGYSWLRRILPEARGEFIVFCHDDVELIDDGYDELLACLRDLERIDPGWVLAGNAGHRWSMLHDYHSSRVRHLMQPGLSNKAGNVPGRVESLDENFFVMPRARAVLGSLDLDGFHFYGTDLCLTAEVMGGRSYVIGFELLHKSAGKTGTTYARSRDRFRAKFARFFPLRQMTTTMTSFRFGLMGAFANVRAPTSSPAHAPAVPVRFSHGAGPAPSRMRQMKRKLLKGIR